LTQRTEELAAIDDKTIVFPPEEAIPQAARRVREVWRQYAHVEPALKTVTEITNDYSFAELGRFAVSYRRLFGESPSVTLRRSHG
jgi:hypothetical protein